MDEDTVLELLKKYYLIHGYNKILWDGFDSDIEKFLGVDNVHSVCRDLLRTGLIIGESTCGYKTTNYYESTYYRITDKFVEEFMNDPI